MQEQPVPSTSTDSEHRSPRDPERKPRRWRTVLRFTLVTLLALLVLYLAAAWAARSRLRQARERVASQGQSLRFSDFAAADVADGENASDFLESAGLLLESLRRDAEGGTTVADELYERFREIDRQREAVTAEDIELFRRAVAAGDLVLGVLDEGMERQRARWDVAYYTRNPAAIEIPNLLRRLRLVPLLRARAWLALEDGRPADAYREVGKVYRFSGWLAGETPLLIHTLFGTMIARQALATTEALMQHAPPTAAEMAHLRVEARRWDPRQTYGRALAAERAATFTTLLDQRSWRVLASEVAPLPLTSGMARAALGPWMHANAAAYSDAMTDLIEACEPPAYRRREGRPGRFGELFLPPKWAALARMVMPNLMASCGKRDVLVATLDLMEIAFRLEEHRMATGGYPPSLDVLGDLPAVDPFSGGPYRYRPHAGVAAIYSVGGNGADDGGTPPPPGGMKSVPELHEGDIVWRLP